MTHPKQALTPGQAARECGEKLLDANDERYPFGADDWDAIAAAAIEAAKQSGDFAAAVIQEAEPESDKCRHKSLTLFPFGVECHDCGAEMDE